jgi:hypothetical protein
MNHFDKIKHELPTDLLIGMTEACQELLEYYSSTAKGKSSCSVCMSQMIVEDFIYSSNNQGCSDYYGTHGGCCGCVWSLFEDTTCSNWKRDNGFYDTVCGLRIGNDNQRWKGLRVKMLSSYIDAINCELDRR